MSMEKLTTGLSYVALGAFAAYFGFWWSGAAAQTHALPVVFALGMTATGLAMVSRKRKRLAGPASAFGGLPAARFGESIAIPESAGWAKHDQSEDAALLGHEMKNYLCTLKGNARLLRQRIKGTDRTIIDRIDRVVEKLESFTLDMAHAPNGNATASRQLRPMRLEDAAKACVTTHFHKDASSSPGRSSTPVPPWEIRIAWSRCS